MQTAITSADQDLLQRLQNETEPDLSALAADLGLPLPHLQQRLRFFEDQGWLRGFFGQLFGRALGFDVTAFVLLTCQHSTLWDEISARTLTEEEIQECHTLGGEWTHLLKVQTPSTASLDALVHRVQEWPSVSRTQNLVVMATAKQSTALPLALLKSVVAADSTLSPSDPAQKSAPSQSALPAAQKSVPSQSALPAAQKAVPSQTGPSAAQKSVPSQAAPSAAQKAVPSQTGPSAAQKSVPSQTAPSAVQKSVPSQTGLPAAQKAVPSQTGLPAAQKSVPSQTVPSAVQKSVPSQTALPAAPPLSQAQMRAASLASLPKQPDALSVTNKATSFYPATTARVAVQEAAVSTASAPSQAASGEPPTTSASLSAIPALPPLSAPSSGLPAALSFPPLSSPAGVVPPPAENANLARDPLSSISAAVDVLLPSIEIDVIGELDIATRAASNPQNPMHSPSKARGASSSVELSSSAEGLVAAVPHATTSDGRADAETALVDQTMVTSHREAVMGSHDALPSVDTSVSSNPIHDETPSTADDAEPKNLNERLAFLKRKRDAQQDAQDAQPAQDPRSSHASPSSSVAVVGSSQSSLSSASHAAQSGEIGGVSISVQSGGSGSLDEQIASLPSAFDGDANDHEPSTWVAPAPVLPPQEPSSETRQDLSSVEVPIHSSVDSTNPGLLLESAGQDVWLGRWGGEESQWNDEDPTFEVMIETLEVDELRMVEVLSAVKQMFWSKLRDLSRQCSNENVIAFLHSLDLSSIRMAIRETAQEVAEEIGEVYAQKLDELADARQMDMASRVKYILEQEHRDRIAGDIRTPFREFVERLERLDQARDGMLSLLNDQISAQLSRQKPLLSNALLEKLNQAEEPRGIELAWGLWLEALKRAMALYQAEAPEETAQLTLALEQFISQFDPTYSAILNRILEIWTDKLLPPLEALIDG